jgi:hypothetical protein
MHHVILMGSKFLLLQFCIMRKLVQCGKYFRSFAIPPYTSFAVLVKTILNQNYFQHNQIYTQNEGLAMGAPTSAIPAEIFIQHLEHNDILKILQKHHILDYYRYVDDKLLIIRVYNENCRHNTLNDFNSIHLNIQYTIEIQTNIN